MKWNPGTYNNFRSERMRPFYDCVQLIEMRPSMDVIDLGCGTGDLTLKLAEYLPDPKMVLGVDSSAEMLLESSKYKHDKLSFRQAGIEDQLKENKQWDLIFSHAAIQWITDHRSLITHMISRLKPGVSFWYKYPHNIRTSQIEYWLNLRTPIHTAKHYKTGIADHRYLMQVNMVRSCSGMGVKTYRCSRRFIRLSSMTRMACMIGFPALL